jgi:hypothetical protein
MKKLKVLAFIAALCFPQIAALAFQFFLGFRPFSQDPTRVPFSWDMFANRVERCAVSWKSPLVIGKNSYSKLHDFTLPFEWDVVFDRTLDYRSAAFALCHEWSQSENSASLRCFLPDGTHFNDEFRCQ